MGETPVAWMDGADHGTVLGSLEDDGVLVPSFIDDPYVRNADRINDGEDGDLIPKSNRPSRCPLGI